MAGDRGVSGIKFKTKDPFKGTETLSGKPVRQINIIQNKRPL
ncbi:hypothetical protein SCFA_2900004 [anaerobic digester metagenome]|uniref:Uncharacterized protein n=1 Tax=anaerobic digester metagenome TaxID=1263854 RepID=A0A485M746_9ZZZZ